MYELCSDCSYLLYTVISEYFYAKIKITDYKSARPVKNVIRTDIQTLDTNRITNPQPQNYLPLTKEQHPSTNHHDNPIRLKQSPDTDATNQGHSVAWSLAILSLNCRHYGRHLHPRSERYRSINLLERFRV